VERAAAAAAAVVGAVDEVVVAAAVVGVVTTVLLIIMEEGERIMANLQLVDEVEDEVDEAEEEEGRVVAWMITATQYQHQQKNRPRVPITILVGGEGGGIITEKDVEVIPKLPPNMANMT
jgi:hypothetical protein